jgi:hypothetical protein
MDKTTNSKDQDGYPLCTLHLRYKLLQELCIPQQQPQTWLCVYHSSEPFTQVWQLVTKAYPSSMSKHCTVFIQYCKDFRLPKRKASITHLPRLDHTF